MIGTTILERYRVTKQLGEGGFGAVYQAEDTKFERLVALKILNKVAQQNPEHTRRFIDEAKVTSKLSHRNIPVVYDYGESEEGLLFIVTELFIGGSLEEMISGVLLSPRQASWITSEVNEALVVAHQQGITHRDVKPPNIFIHHGSADEEVKLLDFGIAKLNNHESHTLTGQLFGTPYFMSPEQILGRRDITPAADLYSLGAVLFYNLTSTVPFDGESQFVIFNKHVNAPVPLLMERVPSLNSPRLQQLLEHLMDKNPKMRPQSAYEAREIFAEVEHIAQRLDPQPRQSLLHYWESRSKREVAATEAVSPVRSPRGFEVIETPMRFADSIPPAFELSSDDLSLESIDELSLSDEPTISPINGEEWRPTARLELKELDDALAGDDDTTDNLRRRASSLSEEVTGISMPEDVTTPRFSNPPSPQKTDSPQNREGAQSPSSSLPPSHPAPPLLVERALLSKPPEPSFSISGQSQEVTRFFKGEELESSSKLESRRSRNIWIASAVFLVGLILSLAWFRDDSTSSTLESPLPEREQQDVVMEDPELDIPAPNQEIDHTEPDPYSLTLYEPRPQESKVQRDASQEPISTSPSRKKRKSTSKAKAKIRAKSKSRIRAKSRSRKAAQHRKSKVKKQALKPIKKTLSRSRKRSKPIRKQQIQDHSRLKVRLTVRPALQGGSSYDSGDLVSFTGKVYDGSAIRSDLSIHYEVSASKQGSYRKISGNVLKLKKTRYVRACVAHTPKVCSISERLFVFDSDAVNNLLP